MLIGLVAPSGSGKNVVKKHLKKNYGFSSMHAGAPVKRAMRAGFDLTKPDVTGGKRIEEPNMKLAGADPRTVLEAVGEAIHKTAPGATARVLRRKLMPKLAMGEDVVVDGVRDQHEADAIGRLGGSLLRINSSKVDKPVLPLDKRQAGIKADHTIEHPGSKKGLRGEVDKFVQKMMTEGRNG